MRNKWQYLDIFTVFNLKDDRARGRCVLLCSSILSTMASYLAMSGTLYTAFLTANNFSIVDTGIIGFLPSLAVLFSLLSPIILERFQKRRWILAIGRTCYYTFNIVGITLITRYVQDQQAKLIWFCIVVFFSHSFNALTAGGYSVWHLNFMPNNIRMKYFSYSQVCTSLFSGIVLIGSGLIADAIRGSENELNVLIILRLVGYALAALDIILLTLPKEYPYPQTGEKINFLNTFRLPFRQKKFMLTMMIMAVWNFGGALPSTWTYYLMNSLKIKVATINAVDFAYAIVLLLISPFARKIVARFSWFNTFAFSAIFIGLDTMAYSFINGAANKTAMFLIIRFISHFVGVTLNLSWSNFPYINMPKENQTYFLSFYLIMANLMSFAGQMVGTLFIKSMGDNAITIFGIQQNGPTLLVFIQSCFQIAVALLILTLRKKILPDPDAQE